MKLVVFCMLVSVVCFASNYLRVDTRDNFYTEIQKEAEDGIEIITQYENTKMDYISNPKVLIAKQDNLFKCQLDNILIRHGLPLEPSHSIYITNDNNGVHLGYYDTSKKSCLITILHPITGKTIAVVKYTE